ncbi:DUF7619 domain-containing protein [Flavobacterium stagni]|uniref:T9SS type A sorting domain-containing protein n=1 Tax=Flavobacterium stagni TaxID=2506421 RepID=A0A4V1N2K4_9FLAO|nr:T9SS type A sorting domain-containing protein [Flavobacterium stagni]RXR22197.1 T9SS type A sorting domain-containing protein [Flavobacterium stagni]
MKKIIFFICLLSFGLTTQAQIVTIPDTTLKYYLLNPSGSNPIIDTNGDNEIQVSEAQAVTELTLFAQSITNFTGIEAFVNLNKLTLFSYTGTTFTPFTTLPALQELTLMDHNANSAQFLPQFVNLKKLIIQLSTPIAQLNFNSNPSIEFLEIKNDPNLSTLSISSLTALKTLLVRTQNFSTLNLNANTALETVVLDGPTGNLTSLTINALQNLKSITIPGAYSLPSIALNNKPNLEYVNIGSDLITTLDLTGTTNLKELICGCPINQLDVSQLSQLIRLDIQNQDTPTQPLTTVNLQNNPLLKYLILKKVGLTSLNVSNNPTLEEFQVSDNNLSQINLSQNGNLKIVNIQNNSQISVFTTSNLTQLEQLYILGNSITSLDLTPLQQLKVLYCGSPSIANLDFSQNNLLESLSLFGLPLQSLSISNLTLLKYLNLNSIPISQIDLNANTQLSNIYFQNCNNLETVDMTTQVDPFFNSFFFNCQNLKYILAKNGVWNGNNMVLSMLPNLMYICVDDNEVQSYQNTGPNVSVNSYCSFVPGGSYNTIQGTVTLDINGNGCDNTDIHPDFIRINLTDGSTLSGSTFTHNNGLFNFHVGQGTYTLTPSFQNPYFTSGSSPQSVTFTTTNTQIPVNFCITPTGVNPDLEISILPYFPARPGFDAVYRVIYANKGNQIMNGSLTFNFDDSVMDFLNASVNPNSINTGVLTWNYTNLLPFETREILVTLNINSPTETPAININDQLTYTAQITPISGDMSTEDNQFTYTDGVVGSFDPNDKMCLEGSTVSTTKIGDYLHYQIRFQNTGNAPAENVVIKDIIDTTKFDIATLQLISTSHDSSSRIVNGNQVEFIFPNIMLPGEQVDEPGSHGYVLFKIKTKTNLTNGSTVNNTASIYFDYNFPIVTNTAQTTFTNLGVEEVALEGVTVYPNPVQNTLQVKAKQLIESVQILDHQGRVLEVQIQNEMATQLNFEKYPKGIYFVKVRTASGTAVHKIVKD